MRYVTSFERDAMEKGLSEGIEQGIDRGRVLSLLELLETRFGHISHERRGLMARAEPERVRDWFRRAVTAPSIDAVLTGPDQD